MISVDSTDFFLSEDIGSALKGGVKVCQRQLVNEALVFVTELALNLGREGATSVHRGFHRRFLDRIEAVKLIRHSVLPDVRRAQLRFHGSQLLCEEPPAQP
jgi:hypothetical protein